MILSFGKSSFETYCREMERTRTLSFWDRKKNVLPPDGVSKYCWKSVFMKCPDCGYEWIEELQVLMNLNFSEEWCPVCAKKHTADPKKKGRHKKTPRAVRPRVIPPEISERIAVIDVETTLADEVMSVGCAIVDAVNGYRLIEASYWLVDPFYRQAGMFSAVLDYHGLKESSYFYKKAKDVMDSVSVRERSFEDSVSELHDVLLRYGVKSLFAYNGHFDKRHLLTLKGFDWFDLAIVFSSLDLNHHIELKTFALFYMKAEYGKAHLDESGDGVRYDSLFGDKNQFISWSDLECRFLGFGKTGPRLVKGYSFDRMVRVFPGCKRYKETHNGCIDAIDEAVAMQLMAVDRDEYRIGWLRDTRMEKNKRAEIEESRRTFDISFHETLSMSYMEYVEYLLSKYGKVKDDYFEILDEGKFLSRNYNLCRYLYCGDYVVIGERKIPVIGTEYDSILTNGKGDIFDNMTFWFSPEEKLYICWGVKGRYSRTHEGLLCHHIDEDKGAVLSNPHFAKDYPFSYQKKERLVYCDYIEHLLLHYKLKGEECSGYDLIVAEIKQFMKGNVRYEWQLPCVKRMMERTDDIQTLLSEEILNLGE